MGPEPVSCQPVPFSSGCPFVTERKASHSWREELGAQGGPLCPSPLATWHACGPISHTCSLKLEERSGCPSQSIFLSPSNCRSVARVLLFRRPALRVGCHWALLRACLLPPLPPPTLALPPEGPAEGSSSHLMLTETFAES